MKNTIRLLLVISLCFACNSNTIYKPPTNLIPRDTMVDLLTDMHIAVAAKSMKNLKEKRDINYMQLVYDKYKIDSLRFEQSNIFYTSNIDEYDQLLEDVRLRIEMIASTYQQEKNKQDSIKRSKVKIEEKALDSIRPRKSIHVSKDSLIIQEDRDE